MVNWHPRGNAYPVEWLLRSGRWAEPYAVLRAVDTRFEDKTWGAVYELREYRTDEPLGTFATGDEASVWAWEWILAKERTRHRLAAVRAHERPGHNTGTGLANTPDHVDRD